MNNPQPDGVPLGWPGSASHVRMDIPPDAPIVVIGQAMGGPVGDLSGN
ncbi:hypothetical protein [Jongsikchunia kroppenstedtii]|nr:hypothetical protein [Jongsikchunia kroppenstedtii]